MIEEPPEPWLDEIPVKIPPFKTGDLYESSFNGGLVYCRVSSITPEGEIDTATFLGRIDGSDEALNP